MYKNVSFQIELFDNMHELCSVYAHLCMYKCLCECVF